MKHRLLHWRLLAAAAVAFLLPFCVSCSHSDASKIKGRHDIMRLMDKADALLGTDDGAALAALDSIDASALSGRKLSARYALLYSEALYKNYIPVPSDSLIMVAVRYYSVGNDLENRFRSYYTLGCIYNEIGCADKAAVALSEAESFANASDISDYRQGLLYYQLGTLYSGFMMFSKAESYFTRSARCYESAGKRVHQMYALFEDARCKLGLGDYEIAYTLFNEVSDWGLSNSEESLASDCLLNMLSCSLYAKDSLKARTVYERFISNYDKSQDNAYVLMLLAKYSLFLGKLKDAEDYARKARECQFTRNDSTNILYIESQIQKESGNYSSALSLYEQAISYQNKDLKPLLRQSALLSQNDYYRNLSELESIKAGRRSFAIAILIIVASLLLIIAVLYHMYYRQKLKLEIENHLATIRDLTEDNRTVHVEISRLTETQESSYQTIEELKGKVRELFSCQFSQLDKLYQEMTRLQSLKHVDSATFFRGKVSAYFKDITSKSSQSKMDDIINDTYNGLMVRLSDPKYGLSETDLTILRLLLMGYSVKTVGGLTGINPDNVYQKRHRIVNKISSVSESSAGELRKLLNMSERYTNGGVIFEL